MTLSLLLTLLACRGKDKAVEPTEPTTPATSNQLPTYACPPPPEGARVFSVGTVVAEQAFVQLSGRVQTDWPEEYAWNLMASGISYTHEESCVDLAPMNLYDRDVKTGAAPGEFWFELALNVPGTKVEDFLGLHPQGDGNMNHPTEANHELTIGWRDKDDSYARFVSALSQGWTRSEVCVGQVRPDYVYLTVLWDPAEGPYRTNDWVRTDQPIWFDMELWRTGGGDPKDPTGSAHRSCMALHWYFWPDFSDKDPWWLYYRDYTWAGKEE